MRRLLSKQAQTTLEYAVLIAVVVGALIGMQTYVQRGLQSRLKTAADNVSPTQFEPSLTEVEQTIKHLEYDSSYTVSGGTTSKDESGRTTTYVTDTTVTVGTEDVPLP